MTTPVVAPRSGLNPPRAPAPTPPRHRSNPQEKKNNIVIPEFSAWLTLVLEQCRAENIRNLPRQRAPTPLFPERRPREACSMPISGCHDLPLATFNFPSRNSSQSNCKRIPQNKNPSCRHSVAACVSDHSRGQALPPANPLRTNGNNTQTIVIPESPPPGGASHRSCGCAVAKRLNGEGGAAAFF